MPWLGTEHTSRIAHAASAWLVSKNDEFCIEKEEFCIKNEEICMKNEESFMKMMNFTVIMWRLGAMLGVPNMMNLLIKT